MLVTRWHKIIYAIFYFNMFLSPYLNKTFISFLHTAYGFSYLMVGSQNPGNAV
jgi:hypothetical protein